MAELTRRTTALSRRTWGFTRTPVAPDVSVGPALQQARQGLNLDRAICAVHLGIPERYLRALESEDVSALPGLIYEQHFIARYAAILGLSAEPLREAWAALRYEVATPPSDQFVRRVHRRDLWASPLLWRRLAVVFLVVAIGGYLGDRLLVMVRPPALTVTAPSADVSVTQAVVLVAGSTEHGSAVTINGQTVATSSDGSFETPVTLQPGANTIRVVAAKRYGRSAEVERHVFVPGGQPSPDESSAASAIGRHLNPS